MNNYTLDVRDGLEYTISGIHKNNIVIVDHNLNDLETVAVFKKFLMPSYIGSEKLSTAKYMLNYITKFKNSFSL